MTATYYRSPETQRRERGHAFHAPQAAQSKLPRLYATEGVDAADKLVHLHYFTRGGPGDWWIVECNPDGDAFGFCQPMGREGEWGYVSLDELERVRVTARGLPNLVERDKFWRPTTFSRIREAQR